MATGLVLAIGCGGLAGCVSTQHKNERAKLVAERTLGGRDPQRVTERSRDVHVLGAQLVHGRRGGAIVVELRNGGARPLTDVPVAVGVRAGGRRTVLNGRAGLDWFQTHVPAIPAGGRVTWVWTTRRAVPPGRAWAVAGRSAGAVVTEATGALPQIAAHALPAPAARRGARRASAPGAVRVALVNESDVPQYGLQVYAVARAGGRVVAAGKTSVRHLGSDGRGSARVALVGDPGRHTVRVHALPTIFD